MTLSGLIQWHEALHGLSATAKLLVHTHVQTWPLYEVNMTANLTKLEILGIWYSRAWSTHYIGHFEENFTGQMIQPTVLQHLKTPKYTECNKKLNIQHHEDQRYRGVQKTELNQARSTPDPVEWPVRTACTTGYNGTQYCSTDTVLLIFAFLHTNITSQMWPTADKIMENFIKFGIWNTTLFWVLKPTQD